MRLKNIHTNVLTSTIIRLASINTNFILIRDKVVSIYSKNNSK